MDHKRYVRYHRKGCTGHIVLTRPEKHNALNVAVWEDLDAAISLAEKDDTARVVVVRGEGKSFCTGLDLSPEHSLLARGKNANAAQKVNFYNQVKRLQHIHNRLECLHKPTIAAIQGHCIGSGLELALCCDIRLCTQGTVFALPEAKFAVITDVGGLQRLTKVVGRGHAREIAFRGHRFDTQYARSINLVNAVFPDQDALMMGVQEMADEIAANPPLAVQGIKEVMLFNEDAPLAHALAYNAARSSMIIPSEDLFEAGSAYMEKRKGSFKGK
jgi:enoyl-CoA hydratase